MASFAYEAVSKGSILHILSASGWALNPRRLAKAEVLTASYQLELHRRMFNATWRWAGRLRATEKTIGVTPHQFNQDLGALLGDVAYWMEHKVYPADEIAIRFHHRLVAIHLFANGNGRHARLAADILALKMSRPAFPWCAGAGEPGAVRQAYLDALRLADGQDYGALFKFTRLGKI